MNIGWPKTKEDVSSHFKGKLLLLELELEDSSMQQSNVTLIFVPASFGTTSLGSCCSLFDVALVSLNASERHDIASGKFSDWINDAPQLFKRETSHKYSPSLLVFIV
jgi:hypothetical protein